MTAAKDVASGIDALIARLHSDGVEAGQTEAARIVAEARSEATKILAEAKMQAEKTKSDAEQAAKKYENAGKEALDIAMRDAVLSIKSMLMVKFELDVRRMISEKVADPEMLKQMVLEIAGRTAEGAGRREGTEVILPVAVVGPEAIRENADDIKSGKLTQFVLGLSQNMLEEGVTLHASDDLQGGIRAHLKDGEMILDLSDDAIASLLMEHLRPRFRAVLEGVIK